MTLCTRADVVRAMDCLARCVNDEEVFDMWLALGVADGDIDAHTTNDELMWYCEDDNFADLMERFLDLMVAAKKFGGLYEDGIVSKYDEE